SRAAGISFAIARPARIIQSHSARAAMSKIKVQFRYFTGAKRQIFSSAQLEGSWDDSGRFRAAPWSARPMIAIAGEDACPAFAAEVELDDSRGTAPFFWGVRLQRPDGTSLWGICTEVRDRNSNERYRALVLRPSPDGKPQREEYHLSHGRWLGARPYFSGPGSPSLRFAVWAPSAQKVEVVFGGPSG